MENLVAYEDFIFSFSEDDKILFEEKLKEHKLTHLDIIIFINIVGQDLPSKVVATGLGISPGIIKCSLAKIRKHFPELRAWNKNIATKKPTAVMDKDPKIPGVKAFGSEIIRSLDEEAVYKHERKYEKRNLGRKPWNDEHNRIKKKF